MMMNKMSDNRSILPMSLFGYVMAALLWISIGIVMRAAVIDGVVEPLALPDDAASTFLSIFANPLLAGVVSPAYSPQSCRPRTRFSTSEPPPSSTTSQSTARTQRRQRVILGTGRHGSACHRRSRLRALFPLRRCHTGGLARRIRLGHVCSLNISGRGSRTELAGRDSCRRSNGNQRRPSHKFCCSAIQHRAALRHQWTTGGIRYLNDSVHRRLADHQTAGARAGYRRRPAYMSKAANAGQQRLLS